MSKEILDILIIDENAIDNMIHKNLLLNCGRELQIIDLPCAEYAIANIESRLSDSGNLPDVVIQNLNFRNEDEYETMYRYLHYRDSLHNIKHIGMSCSEDKRFFRNILDLNSDFEILMKPLNIEKVLTLIYPVEASRSKK